MHTHELDDSQQQSDETTHSEQEDSKQHQYNEAINQSVDNETEYANIEISMIQINLQVQVSRSKNSQAKLFNQVRLRK